ncbi:MAG: hypothetical protein N2053_07800 [Chitinispirillaceae bacterium]|nr:hypothetical protein [Chitinispirillaceae bacterium]
MNTTHVFIVDTTTFKYHLQYLFAGTGAKDHTIDFNNNPLSNLRHTTENNLVSMIADSQRIRKGDYIVFYLQQNYLQKVFEGKFYGIFKAKEDLSFLDNNNQNQYLRKELGKSLTFRTLIEPYEVYAIGVTEWEALDEIKNIQSPNQMLWSLIYRKLKGNRGNTMITIYESERLFKLLRDKNRQNGRPALKNNSFTFDIETQEIKGNNISYTYVGRKIPINILPRLVEKYKNNKAFETHLQAYIVQNIGRGTNKNLDNILLNNSYEIEWIGNEVYCGIGMQKIDILLSVVNKEDSHKRIIVPIELKSVEANENIANQIQRYVDWLEQYYLPNRVSDIHPILISRKISNKTTPNYLRIIKSFEEFNINNKKCLPLKYIEFELAAQRLSFQEIRY